MFHEILPLTEKMKIETLLLSLETLLQPAMESILSHFSYREAMQLSCLSTKLYTSVRDNLPDDLIDSTARHLLHKDLPKWKTFPQKCFTNYRFQQYLILRDPLSFKKHFGIPSEKDLTKLFCTSLYFSQRGRIKFQKTGQNARFLSIEEREKHPDLKPFSTLMDSATTLLQESSYVLAYA